MSPYEDQHTPTETPNAKRQASSGDFTRYAPPPPKDPPMKIGRWTIPNAVSVAATTFLGAVIGNLRGNPLTVFSDPKSAEAAITGAILFGLAATIHLYQTSPPDREVVKAAKEQT